jgi:hypothetical protein
VSAIGAALVSLGVSKDRAIKYEGEIQADRFVVIVHGTAHVINREQTDLNGAADCRLHPRFGAGFGETRPYFSNQLQKQKESFGPNSFG